MGPLAIEVESVSKVFKLYRDKATSAKERVIKLGRMPYEEFRALDDVSFDVAQGESVGLLGHNGSGKSTMLKCITGTMRPTSGRIVTRGRLAALLELGAGFHPELTGRENVYLNGSILGLDKAYIDRRFDEIVEFSEIGAFIDNQVKHYSSGMHSRLGFAVAVSVDPDVLLVDEVLSVGDEAFQRKCIDRVKQFQDEGRTILVVTHAADLVRRICDKAVVLDHGRMVTVDDPGPAIRKFRDSLLARGIDLLGELDDPDDPTGGRRVTNDVKFTYVKVDYPEGREFCRPDEAITVHVGYQANRRIDDVIFGFMIFAPDGAILIGNNSEIVGVDIPYVDGPGEVRFEFPRLPLLDGTFMMSFSAQTHDGGTIYDHREDQDFLHVENPTQAIGVASMPLRFSHHAGVTEPLQAPR